MKIFILVLALCLEGVWSQNLLDNARSSQARRQAEEAEVEEPPPPAAAAPAPPQAAASSVSRQTLGGAASTAYALPDGAEIVVGAIKTTFSCEGRIYGYYADPDNNCQVFHVCVPYQDVENGIDQTVQYSFFCGNLTVFDQESLVCTYPDDAVPCSEASGIYDKVNRNFGNTDKPPRQRAAGDEPESTKDDPEIKETTTITKSANGHENGKTTTTNEATESQ
uniref:Chitin-binding type-2 domain-containing protein n=1 Tax=Strigamia maritima TaxID=126957 RepID=T1J0Q9_STRMM